MLENVQFLRDMALEPEKFCKRHEELLKDYTAECPFKVGDLVMRRDANSSFKYPRNKMPAKVMFVFDSGEGSTADRGLYDMACAVVLDDNKIEVFRFHSRDFVPYQAVD